MQDKVDNVDKHINIAETFKKYLIFHKINGEKGVKLAFSTVALLFSAGNNIHLRKISDNLQTNLRKIS